MSSASQPQQLVSSNFIHLIAYHAQEQGGALSSTTGQARSRARLRKQSNFALLSQVRQPTNALSFRHRPLPSIFTSTFVDSFGLLRSAGRTSSAVRVGRRVAAVTVARRMTVGRIHRVPSRTPTGFTLHPGPCR